MSHFPSTWSGGTTSIYRRNLIKGVVALPFAYGLTPLARAADPLIRYDIASAQGQAMLAVYADAVSRMKALGDANPMSWLWQWYEHFVDGTTTKTNELNRIFGTTPSATRTLANETWNTCQSHTGQDANHFLPWHRLFVLYFERIIQQVSGRTDFTLPYWDYTSSDPTKRGILPAQFRMPSDPIFGSLYRAERTSLANSGLPIQKNQPGDVMNIDDAMAKTSYSTVDTVQGFCRAIDSGIHGRIHVLVGNSKGMGTVPYAARDPLFWVHHSNIDRMWASWNNNGGTNPATATWASHSFVFADVNGVRVKRALSTVFDLSTLGYGYDAYLPAPIPAGAAVKTSTTTTSQKVAKAANGAKLGAKPVSVSLIRFEGAPQANVLGMDPANPQRRAYVVLKDLHTWVQPEVLFHVYLGPGNGSMAPGRNNYVGNINFFDAEFHDHGGGAMDEALGENFYSFDVTPILHRMAGAGIHSSNSLKLTLIPGGTPTNGANPLVGSIEMVIR